MEDPKRKILIMMYYLIKVLTYFIFNIHFVIEFKYYKLDRTITLFEIVGFTKLGVNISPGILLAPGIPDEIFAIALSLIMSIFGKLSGFVIERGSCCSFIKNSRSYCFFPSTLIGLH